ncbi:unnamed protein product [Nippostrongylus brasiliensis]|uniref:Uncharacterized protein n=1 Tax=Nippostrongylus brasiliensis TaxID=27835 RepID=A0A0N4YC50_NIPBR|nr:unnamed protein product [Nippostrongylus brasiliensis]
MAHSNPFDHSARCPQSSLRTAINHVKKIRGETINTDPSFRCASFRVHRRQTYEETLIAVVFSRTEDIRMMCTYVWAKKIVTVAFPSLIAGLGIFTGWSRLPPRSPCTARCR